MQDQIEKYTAKITRDGIATEDGVWFYALDDRLIGPDEGPLLEGAAEIINDLRSVGILFIRPREPWAHLMAARIGPDAPAIVPRDSETKTFFHDIPVIRDREMSDNARGEEIREVLSHRKGAVLESGLIVTRGTITLEQAFITASSILHACFIAYHLDVLAQGFLLPDEEATFNEGHRLRPELALPEPGKLDDGPLTDDDRIQQQIVTAGRMMVEAGLVDSFFGNVSYFDGQTIWISRTAASLDELEDAIDPVPLDGSSTAGVTASSELPAHRAIYEQTNRQAILHGHPKFSVVASMICTDRECAITDCGKLCDKVRHVPVSLDVRGGPGPVSCPTGAEIHLPVVSGEIGAGGIAKRVPPVIDECGAALVYGHGLFVVGQNGFRETMDRMIAMENAARRWVLDMFPRS